MLLRRPPPENVYSYDQLTRATEFIWNMLSFKRIVDEGRLYVEEDGVNEETLLRRYSRMFCEVKQMSSDADKNRNILVVANDKLFLLQVIKSDGKPATFKAINNGLYRICDLSLHSDPGLPIPLLSTASPTIWNRSFKELKEISERNSANLESIDRAIFAVCLDSYSSHKRDDISIHQFSMNFDCGNRWFDKPLSIIVNNSARSGLCANLQYTDIQAASRVINYIIANEPAKRTDPSNDRVEVVEPKALEWDTNDKIVKLLDDAKDGIREYVYPIEACVLETKYYGRKFINEICKLQLLS